MADPETTPSLVANDLDETTSEVPEHSGSANSCVRSLGDPPELTAAHDGWEPAVEEHEDLAALEARVENLELRGDQPEALAEGLLALYERVRGVDFAGAHKLLLRRARLLWEMMQDEPGREALRLASTSAEQVGDGIRLAECLLLRAELWPLDDDAPQLARRAYELLQQRGAGPERLVEALRFWSKVEPQERAPSEHLLGLLEAIGDFAALVETLDALASSSSEHDERTRYLYRAGVIACDELGDVAEAWRRLEPLFREGHADAQEALGRAADLGGRHAELAALYVELARDEQNAEVALSLWRRAAHRYQRAGEPALALECCLRAFAKDLSRTDLLEYAERLADAADAWGRLGAVYGRLICTTDVAAVKMKLLTRHAVVLEERLADPSAALERICQALWLAPDSDLLLVEAERLAARAPAPAWMYAVYMRRACAVADVGEKIKAWLSAADIASAIDEDATRTEECLTQAFLAGALSQEHRGVLDAHIEAALHETDDSVGRVRLLAWSSALEVCAMRLYADPVLASQLYCRAAEIEEHLERGVRAFMLLSRALESTPSDEKLLNALARVASQGGLRIAFAAYLRKLAGVTPFANMECIALKRLLSLLGTSVEPEEELRISERLYTLAPDDFENTQRLCRCLDAAGRYQDLLLVMHRLVEELESPSDKLHWLKAIAQVWEVRLSNPFETNGAWERVLAIAPDDPDALRASAHEGFARA